VDNDRRLPALHPARLEARNPSVAATRRFIGNSAAATLWLALIACPCCETHRTVAAARERLHDGLGMGMIAGLDRDVEIRPLRRHIEEKAPMIDF
jgi:hypothetical protein